MAQLIIEFCINGGWRQKYTNSRFKFFKCVITPRKLEGKDWITGSVTDNREAWRNKLDEITQSAEYDIVRIQKDTDQ